MAVQKSLGSDIVMIFDECTPYPATVEAGLRESMELLPALGGTVQARPPRQFVRLVRHRAGRHASKTCVIRSARVT